MWATLRNREEELATDIIKSDDGKCGERRIGMGNEEWGMGNGEWGMEKVNGELIMKIEFL